MKYYIIYSYLRDMSTYIPWIEILEGDLTYTRTPMIFKTKKKAIKYINDETVILKQYYKRGQVKVVDENEYIAYIL